MTSDPVGQWCEYHHTVNNISHGRRVTQLRVLRTLEASMTGPIVGIDADELEAYIAGMIAGGYHPHTVVAHLRMIRPFLRWCWKRGVIDAERWLRLQEVRGPRGAYDGKPRPYTRHEIRRFWQELDERYPWTRDRVERRTPARGEYWVRRWAEGQSGWKRVYPYARRLQVEAVVAFALYGGLRRNEIYNLAMTDMRYQAEYVLVRSRKGRDGIEKVRAVPIVEPMMLAIGNWTEFRAQVLNPPHDFPWLCLWAGVGANRTEVTQPMSHTQFQYLLSDIGRGWEFHRLRHTFATERYRAGMPIEVLKETLGHASVEQTLGYAKIDTDKILATTRATNAAFLNAVQPTTTQEVT